MTTDDRRLERLLGDVLDGGVPTHAPERLRHHILFTTSRARPRSRWLADIKERPMRLHNGVAAGSPAMRLSYVVILTLLLAILATGTVVAGASLMPGPATIVVAPDGSGDHTTITEAVAAARDGDTVLVRPGTYVESLLITKDITLAGDGDRGTVVIEFTKDGPTTDAYGSQVPYGLMLEDTNATVRNLTIIGPQAGRAIEIDGGAPTLEALTGDIVGGFSGRPQSALGIRGASRAVVRDVTFNDTVQIWGGATPTIEDSEFTCFVAISEASTSPMIRRTSFRDECGYALVYVEGGATPTIEDNDLTFAGTPNEPGIVVEGAGTSPVIRGNEIHEAKTGIAVMTGAAPAIEGNHFTSNATGIDVMDVDSRPSISGNTFCGNATNLDVPAGSTLSLEGNTVCEITASPGP